MLVIDDDASVREALRDLFESVGLRVTLFESARQFLRTKRPDAPSCVVLDVRLPGQSGLDFQRELNERNIGLPIVFPTGRGDIPMSVRAMKAGAVEFLTKPFREQKPASRPPWSGSASGWLSGDTGPATPWTWPLPPTRC